MFIGQDDQTAAHNSYGALSYTEQDHNYGVSAFVGRGVAFKGRIVYNGTVRIDGAMEGEIQTEGCLLVGDGAVVTAKVRAGVVTCKGTLTGDIVADENVQLLSPAVLNGSVATPRLSMEEGVMFNGKVDMAAGKSRTSDAPSVRQKEGARQAQGDGNQLVGSPDNS